MNDYASRSNLLEMCLPHPCRPKGVTPSHQQRSFPFAAAVQGELNRVSQTLTARVDERLKEMGAVWT